MANDIARHPEDALEHTTATGSATVQLDDHMLCKMAGSVANLEKVTQEASTATAYERNMTLLQAIRVNPKPVLFSMLMSLSLIMEGYDTSFLWNIFGYPAFQQKFGHPILTGGYQLSATWQSSLRAAV
ncbi:hypothetical protein PWT90_03225 [Aphanocladium album]|nr:hypothetical protein PWT90_03225 [Aphanocladium album]